MNPRLFSQTARRDTPSDPERGTSRRIVVARPGALGDTLLTFPALALLRQWAPDAHLTFIARADTLPLALANGLADATAPWNLPDWATLFSDASVPLTPLARETLVGADLGVLWAADAEGQLANRLADLRLARRIVAPALQPSDAPQPTHAAQWLAEALRPLGLDLPATAERLASLFTPLRPAAADVATVGALWHRLRLDGRRVVALHPGSGSQAKRWPAERFAKVAQLARNAGFSPLTLTGEADERALAEMQSALALQRLTVPVARGLSVGELAATLARCAGYVGCDSGVSHLAALCGAPTISIFGPTDPQRWRPLGPRATALRAPDTLLASVAADAIWAEMRTLMAEAPGV